jgi:hypothetical protein
VCLSSLSVLDGRRTRKKDLGSQFDGAFSNVSLDSLEHAPLKLGIWCTNSDIVSKKLWNLAFDLIIIIVRCN